MGKKQIGETCTCGAENCLEHLIIHDVFEMDRNKFKKVTSDDIFSFIEELEIKDKEKYIEKMKILGYYIGWAAEIMRFMENSMKAAMDAALDDIFKDWK